MRIYQGHTGIFIPNMKFLCLTLLPGGVCTDDTNADDDAGCQRRRRTTDKVRVYKPFWLIN